MTEWLSGCSSHAGRVAEWLSGSSSHSGRVAEWLSGCSSHSGRVKARPQLSVFASEDERYYPTPPTPPNQSPTPAQCVCLQAKMNVITTPPHPTTPHQSPTPAQCVCLQANVNVFLPHPTRPPPNQSPTPAQCVCLQANVNVITPPHPHPTNSCACTRETQEGGLFARAHVSQKTRAQVRPRPLRSLGIEPSDSVRTVGC